MFVVLVQHIPHHHDSNSLEQSHINTITQNKTTLQIIVGNTTFVEARSGKHYELSMKLNFRLCGCLVLRPSTVRVGKY